MRDTQNEFNATIKEKKRANYHFKPRPLLFGHENLTKKELNALNGETITYKFTECTSMSVFNTYPEDIKKEFLIFLKKRYENRMSYMAAYLGTSRPTMRNILKKYNLYEKVDAHHLPPEATKRLKEQLIKDIGEERASYFKDGYTNGKPKKDRKIKGQKATKSQTDYSCNPKDEYAINENKSDNTVDAKAPIAQPETIVAETSQAMLTIAFHGEINGDELKSKLEKIAAVIETGKYSIDITIVQKG